MIIKLKTATLVLTLALSLLGRPIEAGESDPILKVGISPFSPFVMLSDQQPIGLSIDVWQALSREIEINYEYVLCEGVVDKLKRLEQGSIDIAIGGITITEDRELKFDFTHALFHTGLDILIPNAEKMTFLGLFTSLFKGQKLVFLGGLLLLLVIAGHIIWLVERSGKTYKTTFERKYLPGVFEGMYWALITASTIGYGDKVPQRWIGRILAAILIIIFLPLFGFFIAGLSSDLTLQGLKSNINGPADLWGLRVAVVDGTTSHQYMSKTHAYLSVHNNVDEAIDSLEQNLVDAVVYDAPNLLYYSNNIGKDKFSVVGKIFEPQSYGLALPQGSPLREKINRGILTLIESDELELIEKKWFGYQGSG